MWGSAGARFLSGFFRHMGWELSSHAEVTLEVDPDAWSIAGIEAFEEFGVNRFSVGVQAANSELLKVMDRTHSLADVEKTLNYLAGKNFSVDIMLGLPKSEDRDLKAELDWILGFGPKHLSVYILKARKNYPHLKAIISDESIEKEYLFVSDYLKSHGLHHYEVSNFALPGFESKHNRKYWAAETVHAIGPSATGFIRVSRDQAVRYQQPPTIKDPLVEVLGSKELELEELYLALRTSNGVSLNGRKYEKWLNAGVISTWKDLGYIASLSDKTLILAPHGWLVMDSIMDDLFKFDLA